jgi:hypothetical protein
VGFEGTKGIAVMTEAENPASLRLEELETATGRRIGVEMSESALQQIEETFGRMPRLG